MNRPCGTKRRRQQRHVRGVGERGQLVHRVVGQLPARPDPPLGAGRVVAAGQHTAFARVRDGAYVERRPLAQPGLVGLCPATFHRRPALLRGGHLRHPVLVLEPDLGDLEVGGQVEDRPAVLTGDDPAGAEGTTVAQGLDVVDDRHRGVARAQEVGVQRVARQALVGRADRGDQGLREHLPAEDPLHHRLGLTPTEEVVLDRFEVEELHELLHGGRHQSRSSGSSSRARNCSN